MIARTWRGAVRTADAAAYAAYIDETGYLVERDVTCTHYEVASMARRD